MFTNDVRILLTEARGLSRIATRSKPQVQSKPKSARATFRTTLCCTSVKNEPTSKNAKGEKMKVLIKTLLALSTFATAAMAQVITPVWVEHLNGEQGVTSANRLPILVKNLNKSESNDGTSEQVSLGKMLPYDSARFLLYIRE